MDEALLFFLSEEEILQTIKTEETKNGKAASSYTE